VGEKGRKGEREKGRKGEREKGRKGEREKREREAIRKGNVPRLAASPGLAAHRIFSSMAVPENFCACKSVRMWVYRIEVK
jgi:hypothetical protein